MSPAQLTPHVNLWIEGNGKVVLSLWRIQLLQAIAQTGSISAAAERMAIQYRLAWERLQEMEEGLGVTLVERQVGGSGGGGAQLTDAAWDLISRFTALSEQVMGCLTEQFGQAFGAR